jgi:predicted CXXCH cytochrome family protein
MKSLFFSFLASLWSLLAVAPAHCTEVNLAVVAPPDKSSLDSQSISVVVRAGKNSVDHLKISVNGREQPVPRKNSERHFVCFDGISLSPGINRIKVTAFKEGKKKEEISLNVFSRSELSPAGNTIPAGFKSFFFHTGAFEEKCAPCHSMDFKGMGENPASPDKSPCHTCHKRLLTNYQFVHGPTSVWSCPTCHAVRQGNRKTSLLEADNESCAACHADSIENWKSMKHMHGPTAAGNCTTCHNPHASDHKYLLRMHAADLCIACHGEIVTKPHVVSGFSGKWHPLRISYDPSKPETDFSCVSCHNPHAGDSAYFLKFKKSSSDDLFEFCRSCHKF